MKRILFLVNGQGWGHAVRDRILADKIRQIEPETVIFFASSEDGMHYFTTHGIDCLSLETLTYTELYRRIDPDLIITDEDFKALVLFQSYRQNMIFMTNYLDLIDAETVHLLSGCRYVLYCEFRDSVQQQVIPDNVLFIGPPAFWNEQKDGLLQESASPKTSPQKAMEKDRSNCSPENLLLITLGGCARPAARMENYQLLYRLSQVFLPGYSYVLADPSYQLSSFAWKMPIQLTDSDPMDADLLDKCRLVIARGGWNTLWETSFRKKRCVSVPYSSKVNPLETHTSLLMQKRGLITSVSLDNGKTDLQAMLAYSIKLKPPTISTKSWLQQQASYTTVTQALRTIAYDFHI